MKVTIRHIPGTWEVVQELGDLLYVEAADEDASAYGDKIAASYQVRVGPSWVVSRFVTETLEA